VRVLVAPDKFKGSVSARIVADRIADGLAAAGIESTRLPLADGGDGSIDAAVAAKFTRYPVTVAGATGAPHYSGIAVRNGTAVIEVASTCGMATLPRGIPSPLDASSLGMGQAINQALRQQPRRLVLALGGSASTDGGMGMLAALGYLFYDINGRQFRACGRTLERVHFIDTTRAVNMTGVEIILACDVTNPLLGPIGAAAVYGPQKGARSETVGRLDAGLTSFVEAFVRSGHPHARAVANSPGAGSAGGIGFAALMLGAQMVSGADFFLDLLDFEGHLSESDLVITGEGSIDDQTGQGKLLTVLARRAHPVPVIAVAGRCTIPRDKWSTAGLESVHVLGDFTKGDTATDPALTGKVLTHIGHLIGREQAAAAGARSRGR